MNSVRLTHVLNVHFWWHYRTPQNQPCWSISYAIPTSLSFRHTHCLLSFRCEKQNRCHSEACVQGLFLKSEYLDFRIQKPVLKRRLSKVEICTTSAARRELIDFELVCGKAYSSGAARFTDILKMKRNVPKWRNALARPSEPWPSAAWMYLHVVVITDDFPGGPGIILTGFSHLIKLVFKQVSMHPEVKGCCKHFVVLQDEADPSQKD